MIIEYETSKYVKEIHKIEIEDTKNVFLQGKNMWDNQDTFFGIWPNNNGLSIVTIISYRTIAYKHYLSTNLSTTNDIKEYFKNTSSEETYSSIMVASSILGGIDLRNLQRENGKIDGEKEIYPYTNEQIKMIDKYSRLQETVDIIEQYAEQNFSEENEMEI